MFPVSLCIHEAFVECLPIPAWVKTANGTMLYINAAYTRDYGVSNDEYRGRGDVFVWSPVEARAFHKNDELAITTGAPVWCTEPILNRGTGKTEILKVVKWPIFYQNQTVAVGGAVLDRVAFKRGFIWALLAHFPIKVLKWLISSGSIQNIGGDGS